MEKNVYHFFILKKEVSLLDAMENGGYSKGNNLGAAYSDSMFHNEYYIFSNNDIKFITKFSLQCFVMDFQENSSIGVIGPNVVSPEGTRQNPRKTKGFISQMILQPFNLMWFGCKFNRWLSNIDVNRKKECGWVSGSFMIVRAKFFQKVKGFDENVFLYAEEMILSEKLRRIGVQSVFEPQVTVIHYHRGVHSNYFSRKQNHISLKYYYSNYKNVNKLMIKLSDFCFELSEFIYKIKKQIIG